MNIITIRKALVTALDDAALVSGGVAVTVYDTPMLDFVPDDLPAVTVTVTAIDPKKLTVVNRSQKYEAGYQIVVQGYVEGADDIETADNLETIDGLIRGVALSDLTWSGGAKVDWTNSGRKSDSEGDYRRARCAVVLTVTDIIEHAKAASTAGNKAHLETSPVPNAAAGWEAP